MGVVASTVRGALCEEISPLSIISLIYVTSTPPTGVKEIATVPLFPPAPPREFSQSIR